MSLKYTFNPFTGTLDLFNKLTDPLQFQGSIAVNSDFPTSADVDTGWFYIITADVTDDDGAKTNTGQSFLAGDEIAWNGTDWSELGSTALWVSDGSALTPVSALDVNIATGGAITQNSLNLISVDNTNSIKIGSTAGATFASPDNIAIGTGAAEDWDYGGDGRVIAIGTNAAGKIDNANAVGTIAIGYNAGAANRIYRNMYIGYKAGEKATGSNSLAIGDFAGQDNTGGDNIFVGAYAGANNLGGLGNLYLGESAGITNTVGNFNLYVGRRSGRYRTSSHNTGVGSSALAGASGDATGENLLGLGYQAGMGLTDEDGCVFIGNNVGVTNLLGSDNILAIDNEDTATPLIYGDFSTDELTINGDLETTGSINIATGSEYQQNGVTLISVPSTSATSIAIGNTGFTGTGNYNLLIGNSAGDDLTTATSNVMMGDHAGFRQTGKNNIYIGYQAGYGVNGASNGEANIGIGKNSLLSVTTGYNNIAIGLEAGNKIAGALYNNYIGTYAGRYQTGSGNFALGYNALAGVNGASNGANNIVMGYYAGSRITTGSTNLLLGRNNGLGLSTHSGNVFLGYEVGKTNLVASNQLAIDNSDTATPLIYGEFDNDFIKINGYLTLATKTLEGTPVAGSLEYDGCSMYVTNVATQRAIDRTSDVAVETVTVAGTTTETTLWTGVQSANSLCAGNLLKFHADGIISNGGATAADQITLRIKVGGSTVATLAPITKSIPIGSHWHIDANATQRTIGASGSRAVHIDLVIDDNEETVITTATIDTTASMDVTITAEWASADADNTISLYQGFMEYKN